MERMDVDAAVALLQQCITRAAATVYGYKSTHKTKSQHKHKPWFDAECRAQKRTVTAFLKLHPHTHAARQQQKELKQRKKRAFHRLKAEQLCALAEAEPGTFWRRFRKRAEGVKGITSQALRDGFERLYQPPPAAHGSLLAQAVLVAGRTRHPCADLWSGDK